MDNIEEQNIIVVDDFNGKFKINQNYKPIAEALCIKYNELKYVPYNSILFIENLEDKKRKNNKTVYAQISKTSEKWQDIIYQTTGKYFEYILEIFKENTSEMNRAQIVALIYHELNHIQIIDGEYKIVGHDVEDWAHMIEKLGLNWANTKSDIPDILADGVNWDTIEKQITLFNNATLRLVK